MTRKYNFNPGPTGLPESVLRKAQAALLDFQGLGIGIMEMSHRTKEFDQVLAGAKARLRRLLSLPDDYHILFLQGGARTQFATIPMNFAHAGPSAYMNTGIWSDKAIQEAELFGETRVIASSKATKYNHYPKFQPSMLKGDESYLHITSNNTVMGTQIHEWPDTGDVPLIVDMSSDIITREVDYSQFDMVYAGAQKNIGPAGVTIAMVRDGFAKKAKYEHLPMMFRYQTFIDTDSLYNTPPVWNIYIVSLVLEWMEEQGGLPTFIKSNQKKAKIIYDLIDQSSGFYTGTVKKESRSEMNITFRLPSEDLEEKLVAEALEHGFVGLKGHRIVGGIRISNYNPVSVEAIEKLADYLIGFAAKHR